MRSDQQSLSLEMIIESPSAPFLFRQPKETLAPILLTVAHSGRYYPPHFIRQIGVDLMLLRQSEDAFIDWLVGYPPFPVLIAQAARTYIDLNRGAQELDPLLFKEMPIEEEPSHSIRVQSGLGILPRLVNGITEIYREKIALKEAKKRIEEYHRPFHDQLQKAIDEMKQKFGTCLVLDCHSMPSTHRAGEEADIVLGDNFGVSCASGMIDEVEQFFMDRHAKVRRNTPYAGGYITLHYGRPSANQHVLQIEINRRLYMEEESLKPGPGFLDMQQHLQLLFAQLAKNWQKLVEVRRSKDELPST